MTSQNVDFSLLRPHLARIAWTQWPCLLVSALLLDGGRGLRICIIAMLVHWLIIAYVLVRTQDELSPTDKSLVRGGFLPCLLCAILFASFVG